MIKDIDSLKEQLLKLGQTKDLLEKRIVALRNEFKAYLPANVCPVYLSRQGGNKSLTALFWRYSSTVKGKKGLRPKTNDFWKLIEPMPQNLKNKIIEIEKQRIELNYEMAMTAYTIPRLERMITDYGNWVKAVKRLIV